MTTLYLIRGVSGSGKSTLAKKLSEATGAVVLEADQFFIHSGEYKFDQRKLGEAHRRCEQDCYDILWGGKDVIVSNTSVRASDVAQYQGIAADCGAMFISMVVENYHDGESVHGVPEETMKRQEATLRNNIKLH